MDRCIDKDFVNDFIKKNSLGLTKLKYKQNQQIMILIF